MKIFGILLFTILTISCTQKPLGKKQQKFAGTWQGHGTTLEIYQDGSIRYESKTGSSSVSINGPIQGFTKKGFEVGFLFLSTEFVVDKPPRKNKKGQWWMVVDGKKLTKVQAH